MAPPRLWPTPEDLRRALRSPLPGRRAQLWMAPQPRPMDADHEPHLAAVLVLLYPTDAGWCFPLTLRTNAVATHQSQVSLPGGARQGLESLGHTALRETGEEIGIATDEVEILGNLTPVYVAVSDFQVFPFVGYLRAKPVFSLNRQEVAEVLEASLEMLLDERIRHEEDWDLPDGRHFHVPYFLIHGHKVWGATAVILGELVWLLRGMARPER